MTGRGQRQLKINTTKKGKKQLIFIGCLAYNMSDLSGPTRNMQFPVVLACKINKTHKPPLPRQGANHRGVDTGLDYRFG